MKSRIVSVAIIVIGNAMIVFSIKYNTQSIPIESLTTEYKPEVAAKMCFLKPDVGPCRSAISMYYFEPETKECNTFKWGGCQGNGNRFDTEFECKKACLTQPGSVNIKPAYCQLSFDYGNCFGDVKRWYFDRTWKVCKETLYSGCGGNKNNFDTYEQCDSLCRLGKDSLTDGEKNRIEIHRSMTNVPTNITENDSRMK